MGAKINDWGSQQKSEMARSIRAERRKTYRYSTLHPSNTGYRFLTDKELKVWYARLNQIMGGPQ